MPPQNVNTPLKVEDFTQAPAAQGSGLPAVIGRPAQAVQGQPWWGGPVTDLDDGSHPEDDLLLPWTLDPAATWLDYRCTVTVLLDPGTALHKPLPQQAAAVDTLASFDVSDYALAAQAQGGINLDSNSQAVDLIQRMATSTYTFVLSGYGFRAGFQVPIPGLVRVGAVTFTAANPQASSSEIVGGFFGGIPLWYSQWELHYIVTSSPKLKAPLAAANPAARLRPDTANPTAVGAPRLPTDQNAVRQAPGPGRVGNLGVFLSR